MGNVETAYSQCCGPREVPKLDSCPVSGHYVGGPSQDAVRPIGYNQALGTHEAASVGGPPPAPTGRKRALLVGCNYPGSRAELHGCVNDVIRMSNLLRRRYDFTPYQVRLLTDDGLGSHGPPTRANILEGLRWLVEGVQPGDALFLHYSGHGGQQEDPNYAEEDGYDETILPTDWEHAGMIVDDEIFDYVIAPLPSGAKLTAVMDCCHSGTGLDLPFVWQGGQWVEEDNPCHSAGDVLLVSGCMDEQTSADATGNRGEAAGAMTTALCDTIEEYPASSGPHVVELLQSMHVKLRERGFEQIPNLTSSQRFDVSQRRFSMTEGFESNTNPLLGRHFRKTKHPKVEFGGDFGDMLAAASTAMAFAPMVSGLFGGHHAQGPAPAPAPAEGGAMFDASQSAPLTSFGGGYEAQQAAPLASFGSTAYGPGAGYGEQSSGSEGWDDGGDDDDGGWDD